MRLMNMAKSKQFHNTTAGSLIKRILPMDCTRNLIFISILYLPAGNKTSFITILGLF